MERHLLLTSLHSLLLLIKRPNSTLFLYCVSSVCTYYLGDPENCTFQPFIWVLLANPGIFMNMIAKHFEKEIIRVTPCKQLSLHMNQRLRPPFVDEQP